MEKLRPHSTAFRAVVHFDLHAIDRALLRGGESLPPRRERIDDEITGLEGTAKGHRQLPGVFVNKATRDIFLLAPEVMVTGFVIPAGVPPTRECTNIHRSFTVYAHAFDLFRCLACPVFFFMLSKMASVALIFFCGLALSTLRNR